MTPNVDRLAKEGARFTDAYAACLSARHTGFHHDWYVATTRWYH